MDYINFFISKEFWIIVYTISKWIFGLLSLILAMGSIWLFLKILKLRQKLSIKETYKEYLKAAKPTKEPQKELKLKEAEKLKQSWDEIEKKLENESERDWKLAIIEADNLLDTILRKKGVPGETIKERLNALKNQNFKIDYNEIWQAHKIRNELVHNANFNLTKKDAVTAFKKYKKALEDLETIIRPLS